jgi:heterotetrameric sarcosine oxidase alpha subunit
VTSRRTPSGGAIDRSRKLRFTFDGKPYAGYPGDTLASALLANGVRLVARSFKYHRPRGVMTAGVEEPNALVTLLNDGVREPNIPATTVEIFDGLLAESQNRFPSLGLDVGAMNGLAGGLFSAGFYYKTFMGPVIGPLRGTRFWMACEWFIRRAAGLGRAGIKPDPSRYGRMNAFCDVLVVGSGPAGLMAARAASAAGKRVMLVEQEPVAGGSARWSAETIDGTPAPAWAAKVAAELDGAGVTVLTRTTAWGRYDGNTVAAIERVTDHKPGPDTGEPRHRHWVIRAGKVVLATGAFERPLVFSGNDTPGVMLAGAVQRYAAEYGVLTGGRLAIVTNNDGAYSAAAAVAAAGGTVAAIVDLRAEISPAARALAGKAGAELLAGHAVVSARGGKALREIVVRPYDRENGAIGPERTIAVDCLGMSGGWSPAIHLASQAGASAVWDERLQAFLPPKPGGDWFSAGAFTGAFTTLEALVEGLAAGAAAAGAQPSRDPAPSVEAFDLDVTPAPILEIRGASAKKAFVDFQHDVTAEDVRLAHREGFVSVEHLKRYTTLGMATDQGKTSNVAGLAIMAQALGKAIPDVGTTRFRPPFAPVSMGSLAAERHGDLRPHRLTPMHDWHVERGAQLYAAGLWHRPMIYGQPGETVEQAYIREARRVREGVGIVDVSTLGKIAVQGPDAAAFLDRVYTNTFSTLPVGKARYGLMLREDGLLLDDGTTWRLGDNDFLMTTTTANAGKVMQHLEYFLDVIWPELRVTVTSVTDQWAGAAISGPKAREVLAACVEDTPVDNVALPFMGIVHGRIAGTPVMICRLSFSGELAYEVYAGAGHALHVWEELLAAGAPFGIVPYGLEALGTLRIEKGHVTGAEMDGRTTARDLYLSGMLSSKKPFVGSAMMDREGLTAKSRHRLVGLVSLDGRPMGGGAHIAERPDDGGATGSIGHVTAACYSPALGRYIALGLVEGGKARHGTRAWIADPVRGRFGPVEIVSHHFFDPEGSRMHG